MKRNSTHKKNKTKHRSTHKKSMKRNSTHKKSMKINQLGGDKPFITNIDGINYFTDPIMEKYLNPIYGYIMCENGFIKNMYHLAKSDLIDESNKYYNEAQIIEKICKIIPGDIQPTNVIMELKPIDFGRYIAIKYINKNHNITSRNKNKDIVIKEQMKIDKKDKTNLLKYISNFNKYIKID